MSVLTGWVRVEHTGADTASALAEFERSGITLFDVVSVDELTVRFSVSAAHLHRVTELTERRGEKLTVIRKMGLLWTLRSIVHRPLLMGGLAFLLLTACVLPGRIFFISVEGNERISPALILEAAADAGLSFGTSARDIRSEQIKNRILDALPELKWAGVNTYGSRAVLTVRERDDAPEEAENHKVQHIAAARDGMILSATVTAGSGLCAVGQAVQAGDILISGYTDCGISIRATAARGKILAATMRNLTVYTPLIRLERAEKTETNVRYSVRIGKKQINFYKGSGISGAGCVKMYSEYVLRLPGGFSLPVTLRKEWVTDCELRESQTPDSDQWLKAFADAYVQSQMVSGSVTRKEQILQEDGGCRILEGKYACIEDIGICKDEKIGEFHGKADGTDRERGSGG